MRPENKGNDLDHSKLKKGQLLVVKVPPFYDREYIYEINGAGGKLLRATLYHSPRVKKQWTYDDLAMLFENGMMRFAEESDLQKLKSANVSQAEDQNDGDSDQS